MKKIILSLLIFFTTNVVAENRHNQQFWKDAEKGYIHNMGYYKNVNLNIHNETGQTPLMIAVQNGHRAVIDAFSEGIVDITMQDFEGKVAYDYIKKPEGKDEIPKNNIYGALLLLEATQITRGKAKITSGSYSYDTNILDITISGAECEEFLFSENTKCKSLKVGTNHTIFKAIKSKDNKLLDELLPTVDITIKDKRNYSLLWRAILSHNLYAVDKILERGADIYQTDNNDHHIPLFWATMQNDVALLKILFKHGIDINSKNKFGNYILSLAMYQCKSFEAIEFLLNNGANPYLKNKYGKTAFDNQPVFCKDKTNIARMKQLLKEKSVFSP